MTAIIRRLGSSSGFEGVPDSGAGEGLDSAHGDRFLANQQMLEALNWIDADAGKQGVGDPRYDVNHRWIQGTHSDADGGAILPEVLRWIWGK